MDTMKLNRKDIAVEYPAQPVERLEVEMSACKLSLRAGDDGYWVSGSYEDPGGALPLEIEQHGGVVRIAQRVEAHNIFNVAPQPAICNLLLGRGQSYALEIKCGANESDCDLGGLPLTRVRINQAAGKLDLDFTAPNPVEMSRLELSAGAAGVTARNLANACCTQLAVAGGAASFFLGFGGSLRHNAAAMIKTGMAGVEVEIPAGMAAKVSCESFLGGLEAGVEFVQRDGAYWTLAALQGASPLLTIHATVTLGGLKLVAS